MIFLKMIIQSVVLIFILIYLTYVLITSSPCERISRATKPIEIISDGVVIFAKPWVEPETIYRIRNWSARSRLNAAILFRIQFYSNAVPPVVCDWDAQKDQILGTGNYSKSHEEEAQQNIAEGRTQNNSVPPLDQN